MPPISNFRDYYSALAAKCEQVRTSALSDVTDIAAAHRTIEFLGVWRDVLADRPECVTLNYSVQELQISVFALVNGLYRPAYNSLRLSLELSLGTVFFSVNRLNLEEWRRGVGDLNWGTVVNPDNGVFSPRYVAAFFPGLGYLSHAQIMAVNAYRNLSEFVHGNLQTLLSTPETIEFAETLHRNFFGLFEQVSHLVCLALALRYLPELDRERLGKLESHILDELGHIEAVRDRFQTN